MKKCDLHIHTIATNSDSTFEFSLNVLKDYVQKMSIDVIAITNHNVFDMENYLAIKTALNKVVVLPGIEIDLEGGHILVITNMDDSELNDFDLKSEAIHNKIATNTDIITLDEFNSIFTNLNKYLLIPHYEKEPALPKPIIEALQEHIFAGEVTSIKKFIYMQKLDTEKLTPVIFSDFRSDKKVSNSIYPVRQTYLDINQVNINALNVCLRDKSKATLTAQDGNNLFTVFSNGQMLSTGLNIMYGRRSTGKTWTLDNVADIFGDRAKYIKQFELQNYGNKSSSDQFEYDQKVRLESVVTSYLKPFKEVLDDIILLDDENDDDIQTDKYLKTLLKRSEQENMNDVYSRSALYDEIPFSKDTAKQLKSVINAVLVLIENITYQDMIIRHVAINNLKRLLKELIENLRIKESDIKNKTLTNNILKDIQTALQIQSTLPLIPNIDLYEIAKRNVKRKKYVNIVKCLKRPRVIHDENMLQFRIKVTTLLYKNASDVKGGHGIDASLAFAYKAYNEPLKYLKRLIEAGIDTSKLYKLFVGINYSINNSSGHSVSGGERSEFTFLQKIKDAKTKDILLIDEPESSFDNIFLKRDINKFVKDIAAKMPVVVSTHNNTIGGSIKPDYILYTDKKNDKEFLLFSGYPTDKILHTVDGREINNFKITISSLEAGEEAYNERNNIYETLKD